MRHGCEICHAAMLWAIETKRSTQLRLRQTSIASMIPVVFATTQIVFALTQVSDQCEKMAQSHGVVWLRRLKKDMPRNYLSFSCCLFVALERLLWLTNARWCSTKSLKLNACVYLARSVLYATFGSQLQLSNLNKSKA